MYGECKGHVVCSQRNTASNRHQQRNNNADKNTQQPHTTHTHVMPHISRISAVKAAAIELKGFRYISRSPTRGIGVSQQSRWKPVCTSSTKAARCAYNMMKTRKRGSPVLETKVRGRRGAAYCVCYSAGFRLASDNQCAHHQSHY